MNEQMAHQAGPEQVLCRRHTQKEETTAAEPVLPLKEKVAKRKWRSHRLPNPAALCFLILTVLAFFAALFWLPVLQMHGDSMSPAIRPGDLLLTVRTSGAGPGDIVAFHHNDKLLIRRVIAQDGDQVNIDGQGRVTVNGKPLAEPYLIRPAVGNSNITFPYRVPKGRLFVLADDRENGIDSRNTAVGCVAKEQLLGRVIWRLWPADRIGADFAPQP